MIIELILIIVSFGKLVSVDLEAQTTWMANQQKSNNITYEITGMNGQYLIVDVKLSEKNRDFLLVSAYYRAVDNLNDQFTQGETIDMISSFENRLTRQLIITNRSPTVYVSTLDIKRISKYSITITTSDTYPCVNSCSGNGYCIDSVCKCEADFIGNDCSQEAVSIREYNQEIQLTQNPQFFYFDLPGNEGEEVTIELSTDSENDIKVYLLKTQALIVPNNEQTYNPYYYYEEIIVKKHKSKYVKVFSYYYKTKIDKLVFTAYVPNNDIISDSSSLYFSTIQFEAPKKPYVLFFTIAIPIIVVIIVIIYIFKFVKGRRIILIFNTNQGLIGQRAQQYTQYQPRNT